MKLNKPCLRCIILKMKQEVKQETIENYTDQHTTIPTVEDETGQPKVNEEVQQIYPLNPNQEEESGKEEELIQGPLAKEEFIQGYIPPNSKNEGPTKEE